MFIKYIIIFEPLYDKFIFYEPPPQSNFLTSWHLDHLDLEGGEGLCGVGQRTDGGIGMLRLSGVEGWGSRGNV